MSIFATIAIIISLRLLNNYFTEDSQEKPLLINNKKTAISSMLTNSYDVLGIAYNQRINVDIINNAFQKRLQLSINGNVTEDIPTYSLQELNAAKECLIDFCNYIGTWS